VIARDRLKAGLAVASCLTLLVACGSQVPPGKFVGATGFPNANGVGGTGANGLPVVGVGGNSSAPGSVLGTGNTGSGGNGGSGGSGGGLGNSGGGPGGSGGSGGGAVSGVHAASCAGFKNGPGMTNSQITIANVADLSGPVPGLFKSAQNAVTAYVAYFNATSSICGRKLKLIGLDSQTSESGDQQAATTACGSAFAMVGSMGAFDAGGADTVTHCGIPDLRSATTETARQQSPVVYSAYALNSSEIPNTAFNFFKRVGGDAYQHAAFVYLNAGASTLNAQHFIAAEQKLGYNFVYTQPINVAGGLIPYDSYATQMASKGVKYVQYIGAAAPYAQQLKQAIDNEAQNNSSFHPMFVMDPTGYDDSYTSGGSYTDGTWSFVPAPLYLNPDEIAKNPQLSTYVQWLQRTSGGAPTFFGIYAWAAAAMFTQLAVQLGGQLTRQSLLAAVAKLHNFTDNGMVPPQDVGGKNTPTCMSIVQRSSSGWVRKSPYPYSCGQLIHA
jgi:ABC-type branched-subunit amino acid transport system substrate-binding protein